MFGSFIYNIFVGVEDCGILFKPIKIVILISVFIAIISLLRDINKLI